MNAQPAANKAGPASKKAASKAPNRPAGKAGFPSVFTAAGREPPDGPEDSDGSSFDEDVFQEEGRDRRAEEFEDDPEDDPLPSARYRFNCGNPFPDGPGANSCGVCGAGRPAPAHTNPLVNGAAAASSAGSSAPLGLAVQATHLSEQGSGSRMTEKVGEDKLVKQREIQHFKIPMLTNNAAE